VTSSAVSKPTFTVSSTIGSSLFLSLSMPPSQC
jgi:hypothetical protein